MVINSKCCKDENMMVTLILDCNTKWSALHQERSFQTEWHRTLFWWCRYRIWYDKPCYIIEENKNRTQDLVSDGISGFDIFIALCKLGLVWLHAVETCWVEGDRDPSLWTTIGLLVIIKLLQLFFPIDLHWDPQTNAPRNKEVRLTIISFFKRLS